MGGKSPHYRYVKGGTTFEFGANRAHWGGTLTGTWSVHLHFRSNESLGDRVWPLPRAAIEDIAADIAAALRAWPTAAGQPEIPVSVVCVSVMTQDAKIDGPASIHEHRYRLTFGHPLALRSIPPSTRWQMRQVMHRGRDRWKGAEEVRERQALVSRDGVELIRIPTLKGPADDGPDDYQYVDDGVMFEFTAERRLSMPLVTDTWEVQLNPRRTNGLSPALRAELGPARCAEIAGNIEEALCAWPLEKGYPYEVPVNRVVFLGADTEPANS